MHKALLFLNGETPKLLPEDLTHYDIIACTDGAYSRYLIDSVIAIDYIIGDLDSLTSSPNNDSIAVIYTPDQNKTDFEKALLFLIEKGITSIDIYGATGRASDHFLGNLSVALQYHTQLSLTFYDNYGYFLFAKPHTIIRNVKEKVITLLPFPLANQVTLTGFVYPLTEVDLMLGGMTSLRNKADSDNVEITFKAGSLLIFVNNECNA